MLLVRPLHPVRHVHGLLPEGIIERRAQGYEVLLDFCKGCGICVTECPRHAMEMEPV